VYEGEYQDGNRHGHGKYTQANGRVYEGEYQDGNRHGHGKYEGEYHDGRVYEGEWQDDIKVDGTYTLADGRVVGRVRRIRI